MENTTKKYQIKLNPHITIYPFISKQISVQEIKHLAKDLIDDGSNTEYTRGICELLANIDGVEDTDCAERASQIAKEFGISDKNSNKMYTIYPVEEKMYTRDEVIKEGNKLADHIQQLIRNTFGCDYLYNELKVKSKEWFEQNVK